jgi:hypothetical protein
VLPHRLKDVIDGSVSPHLPGALAAGTWAPGARRGPLVTPAARQRLACRPLSGPMADQAKRSWPLVQQPEALSGHGGRQGPRFIAPASTTRVHRRKPQPQGSGRPGFGTSFSDVWLRCVAAAPSRRLWGRHNLRHPQQPVVQINYAAMDPRSPPSAAGVCASTPTPPLKGRRWRYMAEQPKTATHLPHQNHAHGQRFSSYLKRALTRYDLSEGGWRLTHP